MFQLFALIARHFSEKRNTFLILFSNFHCIISPSPNHDALISQLISDTSSVIIYYELCLCYWLKIYIRHTELKFRRIAITDIYEADMVMQRNLQSIMPYSETFFESHAKAGDSNTDL